MREWWRWSVASFPALLGKFSQDPLSTFAESGKTPKAPTSSIPSGYILLSPNSCSRYHPLDEESLRWWSKVEKEVAEIHAKGGTVEIPDMFF